MGLQIPISTSFHLPDGRKVTLETGKLATQADGSVMVRLGDTMILATVVSAHEKKEGQSFFPLSVDYQEKFAAAGRIPGNFFRRETKLSDYEILISRLVDRAIRPLFPDDYMNETQVIINLISVEKDAMPDALVGLAASAALAVSDIPFAGPISEVRVARINGVFVVNPDRAALKTADLDIIVAATLQDIMMVEGEADECQEKDLIEAIKIAHEAIKVQCNAQLALANLVGEKALNKRKIEPVQEKDDLKAAVEKFMEQPVKEMARSASDKNARKNRLKAIKDELKAHLIEAHGADFASENSEHISRYYEKSKKKFIRNVILNEHIRLDGRKLDEVRPIWSEVGYLPTTHGSAIFNRGETQSLTSLTLGTKLDQAMIDTAQELGHEKFLLHYNFPPFSVGEARPSRGPGRREVGHANLAGRSLKKLMPSDFPYTIRLVSDILESNGSSSMATVCAGSMALMDGGVPLRAAVSGIAMGLISEAGKNAILSDILGDEDALGDMDFKITGTEKGICGCQMDIKVDGMPYELLEQALEQARRGRIHILGKMAETISAPETDLKPHAPRIVEVIIEKSYIGAVIGPGGSIIQEIQRETGTTINITEVEDKGHVNIFGTSKAALDAALARVNAITFTPTVGEIYTARVASIQPYGAFVDFAGKSGLLHVSEISHSRIERVEDALKEGDEIKVMLVEIDKKTGKMRLSRKATLPPPEEGEGRENGGGNREGGGGYNRENRGGGGGNREGGGGGYNRGGGGDRRDDRRGGDDRPPRRDYR